MESARLQSTTCLGCGRLPNNTANTAQSRWQVPVRGSSLLGGLFLIHFRFLELLLASFRRIVASELRTRPPRDAGAITGAIFRGASRFCRRKKKPDRFWNIATGDEGRKEGVIAHTAAAAAGPNRNRPTPNVDSRVEVRRFLLLYYNTGNGAFPENKVSLTEKRTLGSCWTTTRRSCSRCSFGNGG